MKEIAFDCFSWLMRYLMGISRSSLLITINVRKCSCNTCSGRTFFLNLLSQVSLASSLRPSSNEAGCCPAPHSALASQCFFCIEDHAQLMQPNSCLACHRFRSASYDAARVDRLGSALKTCRKFQYFPAIPSPDCLWSQCMRRIRHRDSVSKVVVRVSLFEVVVAEAAGSCGCGHVHGTLSRIGFGADVCMALNVFSSFMRMLCLCD
jgi:hypothetical protein